MHSHKRVQLCPQPDPLKATLLGEHTVVCSD
jgi:hypothetical protein